MTTKVSNNNGMTIFLRKIPKRNLPRLKNVFLINSFTIGKESLRPIIIDLFKKDGEEIEDIILDTPAKLRLLSMSPSLEERIAAGESIEQIFLSLELSIFSTEDQGLCILGDKQNIAELKKLSTELIKEQSKAFETKPEDEGLPSGLISAEKAETDEIKVLSLGRELGIFNQLILDKDVKDRELKTILDYLTLQYSSSTGELRTAFPDIRWTSENYIKIEKLEDRRYLIDIHAPENEDAASRKSFTVLSFELVLDPALKSAWIPRRETAPFNPWQAIQGIAESKQRLLLNREFETGPYTIKIINPNPDNFTIEISGAKFVKYLDNNVITLYHELVAQIQQNGIGLFLPKGEFIERRSPNEENVTLTHIGKGIDFYELFGLNLRQIVEALLKEIEGITQ